MWRQLAALALLLVGATCTPPATDSAQPTPRPDPLPTVGSGAPLAVGVNAHLLWSDVTAAERTRILDALAGAGVTWIRVDVGWATVAEGGPGMQSGWYLDELEATVAAASARGMAVWAMLWSTPAWARDGGGLSTPPRDPDDYAAAAATLAARFAGRVAVWEVWNEANTSAFFGGAPQEYAALYRAAAVAIGAADPAARVATAGTALADPEWLDAVLRALGPDAATLVDTVSVHPYPVPADAPPSTGTDAAGGNLGAIAATAAVLTAHGLDVPVVVGELGWSTHPNGDGTAAGERGVTEAEQARFTRDALDLIAASYPFVAAVFVYDDRDTDVPDVHQASFGLLTRDLRPKPALDEIGSPTT